MAARKLIIFVTEKHQTIGANHYMHGFEHADFKSELKIVSRYIVKGRKTTVE